MNDGRFHRVNMERQVQAERKKLRMRLLDDIEKAQTLDDLKPVIKALVNRTFVGRQR